VVGDADRIVVIAADAIADVLDQAEARVRKEDEIIMKIQAGERTLVIYGFGARLDTVGPERSGASQQCRRGPLRPGSH
jgi:hypothetical protein